MYSGYWKTIYKLLTLFLLAINSNDLHAQYIIEGAKYRSIRDSVLDNKEYQRKKDPVNSVSVTWEITERGFYRDRYEAWEKKKALKDNYQGRKIKQVLVQHGSGKALVLLKGKDSILITEDAAVREGLLSNAAYPTAEIIKVDTPLYIGSHIPVYVKLQHPENKLVSLQAGIRKTQIPFKYELQSYLPGDVWVMEMGSDGKTKKVYAYTLLPDPEQNPVAPDFFAGNIRSVIVDYNKFKEQDKITVTDGYSFLSGTIYLTGPGSHNNKVVTISGPSLFQAKPLLDMCLPGSTVMLDNVTLSNATGDIIIPMGKSYTLIDREDIRSSYTGLISGPFFKGGDIALYRYVIETLIRLPHVDLNKGKFDFDLSFMVEADGTLTDMAKKDVSGKDEIYKICRDLVKYSNTWIPGAYKERNIRMPLNMRFSIEIK